jgi:uncharacterized membrane protein YkvA (DUF1232 family)
MAGSVAMTEPFPRERVGVLLSRLPAYGRLAWRLSRDPALSKLRRGAVLGAAAYVVSPIDLLPGIIPGIGQMDDVLVAIAALRLALSGLDPQRRRAHLAAAGLREEDLAEDARTVGVAGAWAARRVARGIVRVGRGISDAGAERVRRVPARGTLEAGRERLREGLEGAPARVPRIGRRLPWRGQPGASVDEQAR